MVEASNPGHEPWTTAEVPYIGRRAERPCRNDDVDADGGRRGKAGSPTARDGCRPSATPGLHLPKALMLFNYLWCQYDLEGRGADSGGRTRTV